MLLFTCSLTITTALFDVVYFSSRIFAPDCQKPGLFFCLIYWRKTIVTCPVHLLSNLITTIVGFNVCRWTLIPLLCLRVLFNCWSDQRRPLPLQSTVLSYTVITDSFLLFFFFFLVRLLAPSAATAADCSSSMHLHQQQCMCTCVCVCFGLNLAVCLCVRGKQAS